MNAIARIINLFPQPETPERVVQPNPERTRKELGPKSLAWCAKHIPGFRAAKRDADRAQRHADRINERARS